MQSSCVLVNLDNLRRSKGCNDQVSRLHFFQIERKVGLKGTMPQFSLDFKLSLSVRDWPALVRAWPGGGPSVPNSRQGPLSNAVRAHSLCFISVHVRMRKSRGGDQPSYIAVGSEFFLGEGCPLPRQGAIE
jgi:hypothetical protein